MDFVRLVDEDQISEFALLYPTKLRKKKRITKIFPREHLLRARDWLPLRWLIVSLKMGYRIVKYIVMTLALVVSGALCAQTPAERVATVRAQCEGANAERISARTTTEIGVPSEQREFACRYLQRRFGFVLENVDTSAVTSERYIPVLLLETESEIFLRHSPALAYEQISGAHIAGIKEDYSVSQIADQLPLAVDLFSDRILVLGRELIGPLDTAQYRYEFVGQGATTRIAFVPREGEGFVGEMEIDATGALRNLSAQYQIVSFAVGKRTITILGRCEVAYGEPQVIAEIPANIERLARRRRVRNYTLEGDAAKWRASNPLNEREQATVEMIDSVTRTPLVRDIYSIAIAIASRYYERGPISWGPYDRIMSFNRMEDVRFAYGLRTTDLFSHRLRLTGYAAYGVKDAALKGGGAVEVALNNSLQRKFTVSYRHDLVQLGAGVNPFVEPLVARTSLVRSGKARASMTDELSVRYNHEWIEGAETGLDFSFREIDANGYVPMVAPDGERFERLNVASFGLSARLSHREMKARRYFDYFTLGSRYPILALNATVGVKGLMGSEYNFGRVEANLLYRLPMGRAGESQLILSSGRVFGKVPYPLLKIHAGNGSYYYDRQAFSCMNYLEFVSDVWAEWFYEHHFKGLILGHIPLVKHLKLHEVFVFKGAWGALSERNNGSLATARAAMLFPEGMGSVRKPYLEMGVGIENIFKVLRVDAIWRLTHRESAIENYPIDRFRINISLQLRF